LILLTLLIFRLDAQIAVTPKCELQFNFAIAKLAQIPTSVFLFECNDFADYKAEPFYAGLSKPNAIVLRINRNKSGNAETMHLVPDDPSTA